MEDPKKIVLFDGVCNLCNRSIQFIIRHDKKDEFRFATLQGDLGKQLVKERHIDTDTVDSIILIEPGVAYYTKSTAALKIGTSFGGAWKLLTVLELIPSSLSDIVYDFVARNRYQWYGKMDACMIPTPELKAKFLE
ncbi:thiol-disulfide oxidoreductase DCC family protein [Maribacter polysiphoniae]|uniref:Putative DCC family thiol-disulfide oxidoreductase YuxK n=1 Tax=Maribacter polysiphoniae TaxID=429344 RepID=A0A316DZV7_9FLAO|nr:thiol-disulfide oxidoreductase DCC family protein [Maribacter polysiphoniae]MBD1261343.1 thiol-disulfide oxidoreductase DCC family protein [Maribacter polysiphoniae]PWK23415.1 putative DCC family thiol-disulfide oxidoreductase YuxK [Maribacter polysiphoniae]